MNIANLNFENHEEQKPLCMIAGLDCTKPRLMRELQPSDGAVLIFQDCTKPRLMRELQLIIKNILF